MKLIFLYRRTYQNNKFFHRKEPNLTIDVLEAIVFFTFIQQVWSITMARTKYTNLLKGTEL